MARGVIEVKNSTPGHGRTMWRSRLFWKVFLTFFMVCFGVTAVFFTLASRQQRKQAWELIHARLNDTAAVVELHIAPAVVAGDAQRCQAFIDAVAKESDVRLTLIAPDGLVLADSHEEPRLMSNHRQRPEVQSAAEHGRGDSLRHSATVHETMAYAVLRIDGAEGPAGYVRAAMMWNDVEAALNQSDRLFWFIAPVAALAVLAGCFGCAGRIAASIDQLGRAVESIEAGDYDAHLNFEQRDELGQLGESFNRMAREVEGRVDQLRKTGERLATVLGSMSEGVIAVDDRQRVLLANEAARVMLGMLTPRLTGRPIWEVVRNRAFSGAVDEAFEGLEPCKHEFEFAATRRVLALNAKRLPGDPCPGVVLVLHDVTELRRLERMRQEFVANVSHELKTPLSSIKAYTETLISGAINDAEHNVLFLQRIEEQAERLQTLIFDMLHLARIEAGRELFEISPVSLNDMATRCLTYHQGTAAAKRIDLRLEPPFEEVRVRADEEGLRTILDNLIDNAVKYTPEEGHVVLRWRIQGESACIEVADTGIGIAPQDQLRVFERFYRVDKARSREMGGTGLGLSIVKHLAQAFGGAVTVESELNRGSCFSVWLPVA